jgi:DNA-directed RNA polymerase subunit RPC12/RpoP
MKINCLSCGHGIELDEAYSDYEGQVKCSTCSALLEVKLEEGLVKSVKFLKLTRSAAGET